MGDIFVDTDRITLIGQSLDLQADKQIDANGKYVIPGCVDPHTHMEGPFSGTVVADDFTSGTLAAAVGGTTSLIDFCIQTPGQSFKQALEIWQAKLENNPPAIDVGFHIAVTDFRNSNSIEQLMSLLDEGVTSFKLFMAYKGTFQLDDETLFRVMQLAADTGALIMVHAENGDAIHVLVTQALARGEIEPRYHGLTRPPEAEGEATNRAIQLARIAGCQLYVVHVSCGEAIEPLARARQKGWRAWGETCTQYLLIDESYLEQPNFEGAKYVYTPPPRSKPNQQYLWAAIETDVLSVISTDHAPFFWRDQKTLGAEDFSKIPNGAPGVENRLHIVHEFGVRQGRISLNRMVEVLSTNPAKLFGLYPRKGTIAVGSDADIVIFDPQKKLTLSAATQRCRCDYSLFEGVEVTGAPDVVLRRGEVLVENGELVGQPLRGRFLRRHLSTGLSSHDSVPRGWR